MAPFCLDYLFRKSAGSKVQARFLGDTEYYDKASDCPPITLVHNLIYTIEVQQGNLFARGWTIVRVYDFRGRFLTWIPYSVSPYRFWEVV